MAGGAGLGWLSRWPSRIWGDPRTTARVGGALVLAGVLAAGIGRHELFNLPAEDADRSVYRFATGAAEVEVTTQMPWSRVPSVLPGSADAWTAPSAHAVVMRVELARPRALLLYVHPSRTRPRELPSVAAQSGGARLRILANGTSLGVFDAPALVHPEPDKGAGPPPRIKVAIPVSALGGGTSLRLTLVNEGPQSLGFRHVRLIEATPSVSVSSRGHFPPVSAGLLALGLVLLLRARLQSARERGEGRLVRRAVGPGLGLLILGLAVAGPAAARAVSHWAWLVLILCVLPIGRRPARPAPAPRMWGGRVARAAGNGLLVLCGLAVALAAGEFVLRMVFGNETWARWQLSSPAPAPGPARASGVNSYGFLEREFSAEKAPGIYRIAVLGDSLSISAPRSQRFGDVIAERLNAQPSRRVTYEAVSFGRTGVDTNVETEILQQIVWRTHPDFILLEFYVNDLENGDYSGRPHPYRLVPGDTAAAQWLRGLTGRVLLRRLLEEQYDVLQERLGLVETYPAYMYDRFGDPAGAHWQAAAYELRDFIRECRAHQTPVAIALFPHLSAGLPVGAYEFAELYDQVGELCREQGVPCVDLRATYVPYRDYTRLWVNRFDPHPNALAHRLAAERILEVLGPYWLDAGRARSAEGPRRTGGSAARRPS